MIKAVLFDYGGVLAGGGAHSITDTIAALYGTRIGWDKLEGLHNQLRLGAIANSEFLARLAEAHESPKIVTVEEWNRASQAVFERSAPVYDMAAQLRANGIKTGIISNVYPMTARQNEALGNYDGFDPVVLSCDVHMVKPQAGIYTLAAEKLGIQPKEILLVDDQEKCLPPAQALGMRTLLAKDEEQIMHDAAAIIKSENGINI